MRGADKSRLFFLTGMAVTDTFIFNYWDTVWFQQVDEVVKQI